MSRIFPDAGGDEGQSKQYDTDSLLQAAGGAVSSVVFGFEEQISLDNPMLGTRTIQEEWSEEHAKLLYMISKYAACAATVDAEEQWMRHVPLLVMIYEGCIAGKFHFDYAPSLVRVSKDGRTRRMWLNTSQEGTAAVNDLRAKGLVNGLKLSTEDFQSVTAYQVSKRGMDCIGQIPTVLKREVDSFVFTPGAEHERALLFVKYFATADEDTSPQVGQGQDELDLEDGRYFKLVAENGYIKRSTVTQTEDVSYVSSPYLPSCVRDPRDAKTLTSNADQAKAAGGHKGVNQFGTQLTECISLSNVVCVVGEWIPVGSNQMSALHARLGVAERCQGGLFSAMVDPDPNAVSFEMMPGLTQVRVLDHEMDVFVNIEASINLGAAGGEEPAELLPGEEPPIVQVGASAGGGGGGGGGWWWRWRV
jgi:hypothetical protein